MITAVSIIVVPYDHSESSKKALAKAAALAQADERIELNIITVVETHLLYSEHLSVKGIRDDLLAEAREHLDEAKRNLSQLPNTIKTAVLIGTPSLSIVEYAIQKDAELIIMGSRGVTGLKELFLGSVSHYVVQKSSCPVYIVK
ncbi:universal stress protein [Bacillus sp. SJS]|uniref:universal stress protein n=1 Tax=Bacillus sp. SJS TaxID=1423321 RepID=UPI0004DD4FA3|nr:universal stress protein [Bacillus sp. SJS]KZZ83645.1 hypothetical protein AS29_015175 [Bacillus sp. SJS]